MRPLNGGFSSPIKRHGGKHPLAARIVKLMPRHEVYCEPYLGGGSILFRKPRADHEAIGDLDPHLMTFWMTLAGDHQGAFRRFVRTIGYDEETFGWAVRYLGVMDGVGPGADFMWASAVLALNRMSRSALGRDFAWSERHRRGMPEQLSSWDTMRENLGRAYLRLKGVIVECVPALDLLRRFDSPATLSYLDPPYPHATRTATDAYDCEMTDADHLELLRFLVDELKGRALVSSYPSGMYDQWLGGAGWDRLEIPRKNSACQSDRKTDRVEVVWANFTLDGGTGR